MIEYTVKVFDNGDRYWYLNGQLHREDGPAVEYTDGTRIWYLNDKRHREDGPAIKYANGTREWYSNGKYHREDGPACEYPDGSRCWWLNGNLHREDGPAVELNGPAIEYTDDRCRRLWYLDGVEYTEEEFLKKTAKVKELTVAQIQALLGYPVKVVK